MPLDSERISAMPMMPMLPAKAVRKVRHFLVMRLFIESPSAVGKRIEGFFPMARSVRSSSAAVKGSESETISPSRMRTMRVA